MIITRNLTKRYGNLEAIVDINISFKKNKFYAIRGESGSGKTTLINMIGLLDKPTAGEIKINEETVSDLDSDKKAELRMKKFGFVFQSFYLNPMLKSYENVMMPMYINPEYENENLEERSFRLLKDLRIENRINHFPRELSAGEQQRVAIARALANNPEFIIADEPTGNLDAKNETIVLNMLKELSLQGKCVIVVTHNEIVEKYANEIILLSKGRLVDKNNEC
jgi:putative ABC transport system ATP-binding protein